MRLVVAIVIVTVIVAVYATPNKVASAAKCVMLFLAICVIDPEYYV